MSSNAAALPPPAGVTEPIPRALLHLALPVLASQGLRLAFQWVDALWVRGLGVEATAAVTTSIFAMWWCYSLNDVVAIGITAYVSQLLGAGDRRRAGVAAFHGIRASVLLGLAGTLLGLFGAKAVYGIMSPDPRMVESGASYLGVLMAFAPLPMVGFTCESIMRASGDTRTPLLVDSIAVAVNAVLAPFLIYGVGPIEGFGLRGAAYATVIAWVVLVAGYLWIALRGHPAFPLALRAEGSPVRLGGILRVGVPAAIIGMLFSVVYIVFARAASHFGAASMAVVGIANRVEALQFITSVAIGIAGAALVGQNLGAGRPDRAEQVIRTGLRWNFWISAAVTVLLLAFPGTLLTMFTQDPEVHRVGVPYLRILSLCLIPNGMEIVAAEAILGSGHTRTISWIFTGFSLLRIPLALWSPAWGMGVNGIAWIITLTCIVRGGIILTWAARGTWKQGLKRELATAESPGRGPDTL
jgi:putative MATE family efflux protein